VVSAAFWPLYLGVGSNKVLGWNDLAHDRVWWRAFVKLDGTSVRVLRNIEARFFHWKFKTLCL
jgi:hypothetical protein